MSSKNYAAALANLRVHEGGKVNNPKDPGGRTAYGITQRVYDGYRRNMKLPTQSVYSITELEIASIYRKQYADKIWFERLPDGLDYVVFDGAVNSGPVQSVKWLQRALGTVKVDGILGEATLSAAINFPDHDLLIARICERRLIFLKALKTWATFKSGWTRRVTDVLNVGQAWATGSVAPPVKYVASASAKAVEADAKTVPGKSIADVTAGGGVVGATVTQITDALTPAAAHSQTVATIITVVTVVGSVAAVAGIAYRLWASRQQRQLDDALDRRPQAFDPANDNELELQADAA